MGGGGGLVEWDVEYMVEGKGTGGGNDQFDAVEEEGNGGGKMGLEGNKGRESQCGGACMGYRFG